MIARHLTEARVVERSTEALPDFWTLVDCPPEPGACWRWRGGDDRYGRPVLRVWHVTALAVRIAWYAVTGRYPTGMRFVHACGERRCVRPSHLRWTASHAARRELEAYSDGYADATGPLHPDAELAAARRHAVARIPVAAPVIRRAAS